MATNIEDYPSGSKSGKKLPEDVKPIAEGSVKKKRLISGDAVKEKGTRIWFDIIWPNLRDMAIDVFRAALSGNTRSGSSYNGSRTSYGNYYDNQNNRRNYSSYRDSGVPNEEISYPSYDQARDVLEDLVHSLHEYGEVTLAYYHERSGDYNYHYTYKDWGWINNKESGYALERSDVRRVGGRYIITLPRPEQIN